MKSHVFAALTAAGLIAAGLVGFVLAAQIDCGDIYETGSACAATKQQSWILASIPTVLGFVLLLAVPASMHNDSDEVSYPGSGSAPAEHESGPASAPSPAPQQRRSTPTTQPRRAERGPTSTDGAE